MSLTDFEKKEKKTEEYELLKLKQLIKSIEPINKKKFEIKKIKKNMFNPTLKNPYMQISTKQGKEYSIWFKPKIYLPYNEKTQEIYPDFIFIKKKTKELYNLENIEKQIKTHKQLSEKMKKELSKKLIKKIKKINLLLYLKKNLTQKELKKIIITTTWLKPEHVLIIIEEYLKPELKIIIPKNINYVENTGVNEQKAKQAIKKLL